MNTITKSLMGPSPLAGLPVAAKSSSTSTATSSTSSISTQRLASVMLAAGVAALVVIAAQLIDTWAQSHVAAAWLALWAVAALAIGLLRGVSRAFAHRLMTGLDAWSAQVARRRADERLWAMAQSDSRLMTELQVACDRAGEENAPAHNLETLMTRRAARMVRNRLYYI